MGHCQHDDVRVTNEVGDEVREAVHRYPSDFEILCDVVDQASGSRSTPDQLQGAFERSQERESEAVSLLLVPQRSVVNLADCFVDEADLDGHPSSVSATRWRTVVQL